jgi:hypothetical protein
MSSILDKPMQPTTGLNRAQWEAKHGSRKLTAAWKHLGWKWQPVICRCLANCVLSTASKYDTSPRTKKSSKEV